MSSVDVAVLSAIPKIVREMYCDGQAFGPSQSKASVGRGIPVQGVLNVRCLFG